MAIGQVQATAVTQSVSGRPRTRSTPADFGAGVGQALGGLSNALELTARANSQLLSAQAQRQGQIDTYAAQKSFLEWQTRTVEGVAAAKSKAPSNPSGFTNETYKSLQDSGASFLSALPRSVQDKFSVKVAQVQQRLSLDAYNYEYQGTNSFMLIGVKDALKSAETAVAQSPASYDKQFGQIAELINSSALEQKQKDALIKQAGDKLLLANFQGELLSAQGGGGTVRPPNQGDVVAAGLSGGIRGVLNGISGSESAGAYDILNGGGHFTDYSAHPNKKVLITSGPNKGKYSTAAGRYQFVYATWIMVKNARGLTDFSPESQDRAAAWYARKIYADATGLSLDEVLSQGDRGQIESMRSILAQSNGWEGLKNLSDAAFANTVLGSQGIAGGPTGSAQLPDPFTDARYGSIPLAQKLQLASQATLQESKRQTQVNAQVTAAQARVNGDLLVGVETGNAGLNDINGAYDTGQLTSRDWKARTDQWGKKNAEVVSAARGQASIISGVAPSAKQFDALVKTTGVLAGLASKDVSVVDQGLVPWLRDTGALPPTAVTKLVNMTNNANDAMFAFRALSELQKVNGDVVSNALTPRLRKQLALYEDYVGVYGTNPQVLEKLGVGVPPRDQGTLVQLQTQGEALGKTLSTEDIMARVTGGDSGIVKSLALSNPITASAYYGLGGTPTVEPPLDRLQAERMASDYRVLLKDALVQTNGDEAQALRLADKGLPTIWKPMTIDGQLRLMQYAPSSFSGTETRAAQPVVGGPDIPAGTRVYPRIEGSGVDGYGWITEQIRSELDIPADTTVQLVPDQQTRSEAAQGSLPSYTLATKDVNGKYGVIRQADGRPYRYAGYVSSATIAAYAQRAKTNRNLDIITFGSLGGYNPPIQQKAMSDGMRAVGAANETIAAATMPYAQKREAATQAWEQARHHILLTDKNIFSLGAEERKARIRELIPFEVNKAYDKYVLGGK